ncbi:MAG: hypothetical protein ACRDMV_23075 [Streptosporangiales bacterium]
MDANLTLRGQGELQRAYQQEARLYNELKEDSPGDEMLGHGAGILAALDWVLGSTETSPLSGETGVDVTDPEMLDRERRPASRMLRGEESMDARGRQYVSGVETALMWAVGLSDTPL